jgi:CRP-like cAMP-binding protein
VAFSSGECIVDQGRDNDRLYFINQGQVKLVHRQGTREMLIDRIGAGSIAGTESFFKATLTTVAAVTLEPVEASSITRSGLDALHPDHPGLKAKLQEYAVRLDTTADKLRRRNMDRRRHKRFNIKGRIRIQLQDRHKRPVGRPFLGAMADYAIGGVAFCIGSTKSETARILLGRRVQLDFVLPVPESMGRVSVVGTVIAVNDLLANEYSLHVRFDQDMDPAIAEALEATLRNDT